MPGLRQLVPPLITVLCIFACVYVCICLRSMLQLTGVHHSLCSLRRGTDLGGRASAIRAALPLGHKSRAYLGFRLSAKPKMGTKHYFTYQAMLHTHHAHNSEEVHNGLQKALEAGFLNIEVDIHPHSSDDLLVGHDHGQPWSNLQDLYLRPLAERSKNNAGAIYSPLQYRAARIEGKSSPLTLIVDVKEICGQSAETSFDLIHRALVRFADVNPELLTSWRGNDNSPELGAVSIMISGNRPSASHLLAKYPLYRLAILDGREEDLVKDYPLSLMPVISKAWFRGVKALLQGINPMALENKQVVGARALIQRAHSQGRQIRFWGHPDTPKGWQDMLDLGVDQISTDKFLEFQEWLAARVKENRR